KAAKPTTSPLQKPAYAPSAPGEVVLARGRRAAPSVRGADPARPRAVRFGPRLHGRGRGGVRAARSGLARPRQPLRGRPGRGLRGWLPHLLALSCSSPFVENVNTGLHSARSQIFTKMFPRCGIPDHFSGWSEWEDFVRKLYETRSIDEHTQLWWSVRPHLAFP